MLIKADVSKISPVYYVSRVSTERSRQLRSGGNLRAKNKSLLITLGSLFGAGVERRRVAT
jgi:hypothetical protein